MNSPKITWEQAVLKYRNDSANAEAVLACYYDDPILESAERYRQSAEFTELITYLPSMKGKLLDVGAGRGISSYAFAKTGWQVSALEPNPSNIVGGGAIRQLSQLGNINISVVQNWGEKLPFENESFDVVHARAVLHHAHNLQDFCKEVARVLKPGGRLLGIREHVILNDAEHAAFLVKHPLHSLYGGENAFKLSEYRTAFELAGLTVTEELNPWASEINLHPHTFKSLQAKIEAKLRLPFKRFILKFLLSIFGKFNRNPGRLYTFIVDKPIK